MRPGFHHREVSTTLSPEEWKRFWALVAAHGISGRSGTRQAIVEWMERQEASANAAGIGDGRSG